MYGYYLEKQYIINLNFDIFMAKIKSYQIGKCTIFHQFIEVYL